MPDDQGMQTTTVRSPAADGFRAMLPLLVAVAPLGLVVGVRAAEADLPAGAGWATAVLIYGASAQLAAIDLLDQGLAPAAVVLTVAVVNVRLALFSAAMGVHWSETRPGQRLLASYLLVDPSYAVGEEGYRRFRTAADGLSHYLAGAITLWVGWQVAIATGLVLGTRLPAGLHLEFAVPLALVAIVAPQIDSRGGAMTVAVAGSVAVVGQGLPMASGLPLAMVAGATAGALSAARTEQP
jgi:predicted branched-subunit amino acid permease